MLLPANNVVGENGAGAFDGLGGAQSAYGAVKALQTAQQAMPIGSAPGVNAPKQATRASQKPSNAQEQSSPPPPTPLPVSAQEWHRTTWAEIAADPEASDLVKQFADRA